MLSLLAVAASSALVGSIAPESNLTVIEVDAGTWNGRFTVRALERADQVELKLVGHMDFLDKSPAFDAMMTWTLPLEAVRVTTEGAEQRVINRNGEWILSIKSVGPGVVTWTRPHHVQGSITVHAPSTRSLRLSPGQTATLFDALLDDASEVCEPSLETALSTARHIARPAGLASFEYTCDLVPRAASVSVHVRE